MVWIETRWDLSAKISCDSLGAPGTCVWGQQGCKIRPKHPRGRDAATKQGKMDFEPPDALSGEAWVKCSGGHSRAMKLEHVPTQHKPTKK